MTIRERHGVLGVRIATDNSDVRSVTVGDGIGEVMLTVSHISESPVSALTPEQARYVAQQLLLSATRVEKNEEK